MRLIEFFKVSIYRLIEFFAYTICGIKFYRNYSRFYWRNKANNGSSLPFQKDYYF